MATNENIIKNMANEITRNCQAQNVATEPEFVVYLIELLLLNPKYGKLFSETLNRDNLQYFVKECVAMLARADTPLNTLKMQFEINKNYAELHMLIEQHRGAIRKGLQPLLEDIMISDPEFHDEDSFRKLFRKISIYCIMASGLGNPAVIYTLREGMAALQSVFSLQELKEFVTLPWVEKKSQLAELLEVVSGVRLFNRDCKKGGDGIPDHLKMACNENIIKNMANEITRNCQAQNIATEPEFVVYLIELLLLNPKYGKLFSETLNRDNLEYFVKECGAMISRGDASINTLKMQFIVQTNYDKLQNLIDKQHDSIENCLKPLVDEIMDEYPDPDDEAAFMKLFRKISIYCILASGLGNPGIIITLKEGMAALESVFEMDDLKLFVDLPRPEKVEQLTGLLEITSGVRLFNRDCKLGGELIPDLPFNLVDAGKACLASLSHMLMSVMQRVNKLTTAIEDSISIIDETGTACVVIPPNSNTTLDDYQQIFDLLAFNRQYELFIRKFLSDVESMVYHSTQLMERVKTALEELHVAVKYKAAVPVTTVFPLFTKLWQVWRSMQNTMYLVSTVDRLVKALAGISEHMKIPPQKLENMLKGKPVVTDQERMSLTVSMDEPVSMQNYSAFNFSFSTTDMKERHVEFLGFCAMSLSVGALVPSTPKIGLIKSRGKRYGFSCVKMAARFVKDPDRYVNAALHYIRNHPHLINLLNISEEVDRKKDIDCLVVPYEPKIKTSDKDIQTETHPIAENIDRAYSWDLWEWKRRACQWATLVNCETHSTQTDYSHLRSEIHCQTVEPRHKSQQTMRDASISTNMCQYYFWGLRGQLGDGQHLMDLVPKHAPEKLKAKSIEACFWSIPVASRTQHDSTSSSQFNAPFYVPKG